MKISVYTTGSNVILFFNSDFNLSCEISSPQTDNNFLVMLSLKKIEIPKLKQCPNV